MIKKAIIPVLVVLLCFSCGQNKENNIGKKTMIMENTVQSAIDSLVKKYGESDKERISRGVRQVASFWQEGDGNDTQFVSYCLENFISDTAMLQKVFERISGNFEIINGSFNSIVVGLQRPLALDLGEILPVDESFGTYNPATHFDDDFFSNKIAFLIALNFPNYTLDEKTNLSAKWTRKDWAYARMGDYFQIARSRRCEPAGC